MNKKKLLKKILAGSKNVRFSDAVKIAEAFGFSLDRINGSHHIFVHPEVSELVNLQDVKGQVKAYQVRQLLKIVEINNLHMEDE
jgi:predicted RNA binding protein YcfA (HicA-like mRNA interferase family)